MQVSKRGCVIATVVTAFKHQTAICEAVWSRYKGNIPASTQRKVVKRLLSLVWLSVQAVAAANKREDFKEMAGSTLAGMLSVSRSTVRNILPALGRNERGGEST